MLFSNTAVAQYINDNYEPTWKSLRPVPKVSVDFGNGTVVNRTLNGNIATFICAPDGTIIDVLAGIYEPREYIRALTSAKNVLRDLPADNVSRSAYLVNYHNSAAMTARLYTPDVIAQPARRSTVVGLLGADTMVNESERRVQVHQYLAADPMQKPDQITHWLYREVLHADLDDPYLGLKPVLFATYPFKDANN